jgi:hypothetical protein
VNTVEQDINLFLIIDIYFLEEGGGAVYLCVPSETSGY